MQNLLLRIYYSALFRCSILTVRPYELPKLGYISLFVLPNNELFVLLYNKIPTKVYLDTVWMCGCARVCLPSPPPHKILRMCTFRALDSESD